MAGNDIYILGVSAFSRDSAAAVLKNGELIAAAQEERFTRRKFDPSFPFNAVRYCLSEAGIDGSRLDLAAFCGRRLTRVARAALPHLEYVPSGADGFISDMRNIRGLDRSPAKYIQEACGYRGRIFFAGHHQAHAASAFYLSPFPESAVMVMDGGGGCVTASLGRGYGNNIDIIRRLTYPHSVGTLYSAFTGYCGFRVNGGEYKLMGLAPYGRPVHEKTILENIIRLAPDGSFLLEPGFLDARSAGIRTLEAFHDLFGGPPRRPESRIEQRHMDLARSIQSVTEKIILRTGEYLHSMTGSGDLCMSGGVALNCVANGRLFREGPFRRIWIQPAATDAGGAPGAALSAWHDMMGEPREADGESDGQKAGLLGPSFTPEEVTGYLDGSGIEYERLDRDELYVRVSGLLAEEKVVGWFQGRMEFGPRALGARSILADPRSSVMQDRINSRVKFREPFRPFAPSVLTEKSSEYFEMETESPYMLMTFQVRDDKRFPRDGKDAGTDVEGAIPAVTHVDGSARVQTVDKRDNEVFHGLLERFYKDHGCPVLVNTSFNVRGEPIVRTPEDACECFFRTDMDCLVIGDILIEKKGRRRTAVPAGTENAHPAPTDEAPAGGDHFMEAMLALAYYFLVFPAGLIRRSLSALQVRPRDEERERGYWKG
jgi:carbamoyltransferase